jgi:hypothetical protein
MRREDLFFEKNLLPRVLLKTRVMQLLPFTLCTVYGWIKQIYQLSFGAIQMLPRRIKAMFSSVEFLSRFGGFCHDPIQYTHKTSGE